MLMEDVAIYFAAPVTLFFILSVSEMEEFLVHKLVSVYLAQVIILVKLVGKALPSVAPSVTSLILLATLDLDLCHKY